MCVDLPTSGVAMQLRYPRCARGSSNKWCCYATPIFAMRAWIFQQVVSLCNSDIRNMCADLPISGIAEQLR